MVRIRGRGHEEGQGGVSQLEAAVVRGRWC